MSSLVGVASKISGAPTGYAVVRLCVGTCCEGEVRSSDSPAPSAVCSVLLSSLVLVLVPNPVLVLVLVLVLVGLESGPPVPPGPSVRPACSA